MSDGCRSEERWSASRIKNATQRGFALLVDDRLRYIYCRVAKVASTSWSRVLLVASGKVRDDSHNTHVLLSSFIINVLKVDSASYPQRDGNV